MNTEDYVSFETAKLLKEKGFDGCCTVLYNSNKQIERTTWPQTVEHDGAYMDRNGYILCPTLQMAMKWLRERNLCIEPYRTACGYLSIISKVPTGSELYAQEYEGDDENSGQFTTYEKSCEAAIKYCLENLI